MILTSYGHVAAHGQAELIRGMGEAKPVAADDAALVARVMAAIK